MELSRRQFLEAVGAVTVTATVDPGRFAQRPDGPNVVLVMIDTLRADHVGAYGGRARTPAIDALARDSLRFTHFYPEAMATVPARRSVMTGRRVFPFRNWHIYRGLMSSPGWAPIADVRDTWTSALRRSGWWTAYVTDNPFIGFSGFYGPFRKSFNRFAGIGGQLGQTAPLSTVSGSQLDHWLVPELRLPHIRKRVHRFLAAGGRYYAAEVTMTDRWLDVLIDRLHALNLERDTVVMLVSDHGYLLGEFGWSGKIASMLHPPMIHVPFLLADPGRRRAGRSTEWPAQTHDIGPTVLDMAGVKRPEPMDGTSLAPLLRAKEPRERRTMAYGGYANWHYARTGRWAYVAANTGKGRRLYDLRADPGERRTVAKHHPRLTAQFEKRVRRAAGGRLPVYD